MTVKPYTYVIKCVPTNQRYYGVRWANKTDPINDLWLRYFTSSKRIKLLIAQYGKENFTYEVRKTFETAKEAVGWETRVLRRLKVLTSDQWLNMAVSSTERLHTSDPKFRAAQSERTKAYYNTPAGERAKESRRKPLSEERRELLRKPRGPYNKSRKHTGKANEGKTSMKTWVIQSPDMSMHTVQNLTAFCIAHNLTKSLLYRTQDDVNPKRKIKSHFGFVIISKT